MPDSDSFASRLVRARTAAGFDTQAKLLAKLANGTAQTTLSSWENGRTTPKVEDVRDLAVALGCSADYLLGLTDDLLGKVAGKWIVDLDLVAMMRQKRVPPDSGRFARPIPTHFEILSSTELEQLQDELFSNKRKK